MAIAEAELREADPPSADSFYAGAFNFAMQLATRDNESYSPAPLAASLQHLSWALRSDAACIARISNAGDRLGQKLVSTKVLPFGGSLPASKEILLPHQLMDIVRSQKHRTIGFEDGDTFSPILQQVNSKVEHSFFSKYNLVCLLECGRRHLLWVGWERGGPPSLHGMNSMIPAIAKVFITGYILPGLTVLGEEAGVIVDINDGPGKLEDISNEAILKIEAWAKNHSLPDAPILFAKGKEWSPAQIAEEVKANSELGIQLRNGLIRQGINKILEHKD